MARTRTGRTERMKPTALPHKQPPLRSRMYEEYEIVVQGRKGGEGGVLAGYIFVFSVPKESEFAEYILQLAGEVSIDLAPFFE
jgi:hypothetical protein